MFKTRLILISLALLFAAPTASAAINPTVKARSCLLNAVREGRSAEACFNADGWSKHGKRFVEQAQSRGETLHGGDESGCCTLPVHWAEVEIKKEGKVIRRAYLIYKKWRGDLIIDRITQTHPEPR